MDSYKPSGDFVARIMENVRSYETAMIKGKGRANETPIPKLVFFAMSAGGILLGALNLVRVAWTFIVPAVCQ